MSNSEQRARREIAANAKNEEIKKGNKYDGVRLLAEEIARKNNLHGRVAGYIIGCVRKNSDSLERIEEIVKEYCKIADSLGYTEKEKGQFIVLFLNRGVCPTKDELYSTIKKYEKKGYTQEQILSLPEIFSDDTPEDIKTLLIILLRKANIAIKPENIAYYTRMGLTKNRDDFIKKVGICLSVGNDAKDILDSYRILTDSVPLDLFYATVIAELNLMDKGFSKLPKLDSGIKVDLQNVVKKVYEENKNIKDGKMFFVPVNTRFVLVPIENMRIYSRATDYMGLPKIKK